GSADSTVTRTPVELGSRDSANVEVTRGLQDGATVVRAGHQKLFDGAHVMPVSSLAASEAGSGAGAAADAPASAGPGNRAGAGGTAPASAGGRAAGRPGKASGGHPDGKQAAAGSSR